MRNDANLLARSPRGGRGSFFPSSIRAISTYLRSVSANASNIASTVRSAAVSPASGGSLHEDDRQREQVQWAGFDRLELGSGEIRHVLLLTYLNGFQVWDVEEASNVRELVSRRDGPVSFLRLQPKPYSQESSDGGGLKAARPLLLVVTGDTSNTGSQSPGGFPGNYNASGAGSPPGGTLPHFIPTIIRCYSLQSHSYVHVLRFRTGIYAVRCSPRVVVVALYNQIYCFDAASLQNTFSVLTYPTPPPGPGATAIGFGAIAVGPRWLAYAANQPLIASTGRVSPQHLTPSPGISPSTSPANASLVAHYAKESSKHIAAGIVTLGDMGYKTISRYCSELLPDGAGSPNVGSPSWKGNSNGHTAWQGASPHEPPEYAGMIIVRDFVSKTIVAQFRAHTSPLSALAFDPSGTLLVTASIYGHNLNVFRLTPSTTSNGVSSTGFDGNTSYVHLYKLYRGLTNAVIQDISFSSDSQWITVSSSRGTSHMFAISPFGGTVGPQTHGAIPMDGLIGPTLMPTPTFPWWSSPGLVRVNQQPLPPPPPAMTLSVVSRVKNGIGGWRGTVTGAAAAATGRTNNVSWAVAAIFHDGGNHNLEGEVGNGCLKEQLWVLSPSGNLIRYLLRPSAGVEGGYSSSGTPGLNTINSGSPGQTQELRLLIEPLEKWDVSRRPNWVEREERVDCLAGPGAAYEEAVLNAIGGQVAGPGGPVMGSGNGGLVKEGISVEEKQRLFMSNAEVQIPSHARPLPIWAKPKVYFHNMVPSEENEGGSVIADGCGGEIEIERIPIRLVEVRRKDLVPVIERLQVFTKAHDARDMTSENIPAVSSLQMQLLVDDVTQEGAAAGTNFGGMHIHRTSSGSSFGSEGGPGGGTMNGFHHNFQDYPEVSVTGTPPSSFESSPSFFHHSQQGGGAPSSFLRTGFQGTLLSPKQLGTDCLQPNFASPSVNTTSNDTGVDVIGSPPMGIPRLAQRDIEIAPGYNTPSRKSEGEVGIGTRFDHSMRASASVGHDSLENRGVFLGPNFSKESQRFGPDSNIVTDQGVKGSVNAMNGQIITLFDQIGLEDGGPHQSQDSPVPSGHKPWDMGLDNPGPAPLVGLSSGGSALHSDEGPAFMFSHERLEVGQEDGHVSFHTQDNGVAEDAESTDDHSKSEDNEGGDPGDDVWEGAMFPFCEDC